MTAWPANTNPILVMFREEFDTGDKLSCTVGYLFALCDIAMTYDVEIPEELHFSQSPFGADTEADTYKTIEELLEPGKYIYDALTVEELQEHVSHALKVLAKYDSLLRQNGWSL